MDYAAYQVKTANGDAIWRINLGKLACDNGGTITSLPFKIFKWNWHISVTRRPNRITLVAQESTNNPPLAFFYLSLLSTDSKVVAKLHQLEYIITHKDGFVWNLDVPIPDQCVIKVQFWDVNVCGRKKSPSSLSRTLRLDIYTDIAIKVSGSDQIIRAHQAVLASLSKVFEKMLEENPSTITIPDMSFETCEALINYLYRDIQEEEFRKYMCELSNAAEKYEIATLKKACAMVLQDDLLLLCHLFREIIQPSV